MFADNRKLEGGKNPYEQNPRSWGENSFQETETSFQETETMQKTDEKKWNPWLSPDVVLQILLSFYQFCDVRKKLWII